MPTPRQEKLAEAIIENAKLAKPKGKGELLRQVGYSGRVADSRPGEVIASQPVQEALAVRGFTAENAKKVVSELMLDEAQDGNIRLKAADMTFKVHGSYAAERTVQMNVNLDVPVNPKAKELADKYEEELRLSYN